MTEYLNRAAALFIYGGFVIGVLVVFKGDIVRGIGLYKSRRRLRRYVKKKGAPVLEHMNRITEFSGDIKGSTLLVLCLISAGATFMLAVGSTNVMVGMIMGLLVGASPYLIFRLRYEGVRRRGSFEGEGLVSAFLNAYRISGFNVYEALEITASERPKGSLTGKLLLKMVLELRHCGSPEEIQQAILPFYQVVDTNWSRMFSYNLQLAAEKGVNISSSLEDIILQLRDARLLYEERQRLNSEAVRMVIYMMPLLYLFTVFSSIYFVGISPGAFIRNQLLTSEGFSLFMLNLLFFLFNLLLIDWVGKKKFDF